MKSSSETRAAKKLRRSELPKCCLGLLLTVAISSSSLGPFAASVVDAHPWGLVKFSHRCIVGRIDDCSSLTDGLPTIQSIKCNNIRRSLLCRGGYADYIDDGDSPWGEKEEQQSKTHTIQQQQPNRGDPINYPPSQQQHSQTYGTNNLQQPPPQFPWHSNNLDRNNDTPSIFSNDSRYIQRGAPGYGGDPPQHQQQQNQQQHPFPQHQQLRNDSMTQRGAPPQQYQRPPYQQQQYPSPPDFPGDVDSRKGLNSQSYQNNLSRIQNAAMSSSSQQPPYGFDEDDDDDDLLPSNRDGFTADQGATLDQSQSSSYPAGGGGMDLSQFNKDIIFSGLKRLYRKKIRPLELSSKYGHFHSPPLSPSDFDSKPMVLLLGQYSVGKTSFIRYLLGRDFPGQRIGPEPTTDRFVAILKGDSGDKIIPGAALCSQGDRPFRGLSPFGNNFLSRFEGVEMDSPILNNITLVDTPGILSGQKQSIGRNYDYEQVMKWFAERADLIIMCVSL